jgi:DNA end-binding protein Ku
MWRPNSEPKQRGDASDPMEVVVVRHAIHIGLPFCLPAPVRGGTARVSAQFTAGSERSESEGRVMPRSLWTGSISFGLVNVPVRLYSAVKQQDVHFHQLERGTNARIKYKRVSEKSGREVPYEKIVKGYELDRGRYVVIDPEELEALDPETTSTIDVTDFVSLEDIDPIYYEHTYYLVPGKGGDHAYRLLHEAMSETQRVAIGKVVMRQKEYLAAVRPLDGALALNTMLFADEIVPLDAIEGIPGRRTKVPPQQLKMAKQLIDSLTSEFEPEQYRDEYRGRVDQLIRRKAKGETVEVEEAPEKRATVVDLMDALRQSLEQPGGSARRSTKKTKSASRRASSRKRSSSRKSA